MKIIGIDMGHPLKKGANGYKDETDMNRLVGNLLISKINANSQLKAINCSKDKMPDNLTERANIANNAKADLFISLHLNASENESAHGIETLITKGESQFGVDFANLIQSELAKTSVCTLNRGVRVDLDYLKYRLGVLSKANMPAVLIEMGFCTNKQDMDLLNENIYANTIYNCILKAFNLNDNTSQEPKPNTTITNVKVGDIVKLKANSKQYNGNSISSFYLNKEYTIKEITNDRAVLIINNVVMYAVNITNLIKTNKTTSTKPGEEYKVKVTTPALNVRIEPNADCRINAVITNFGVYTITQTSGNWGKLKSGLGWINLGYTTKL